MDAAAQAGSPVGEKSSSAYVPPELARIKYAEPPPALPQLAEADRSFDIWSLGVILFELCTGRTLFSQDVSPQASRCLSSRSPF